jgi:uncharacterized protein YndB with AHSA1/START domain
MVASSLTVVARQLYDAPPERVFRAFTEPALLQRWFSPGADVAIEVLAHDLRPGGKYRFRYRESDGTVSIVAGEFREITEPRRLVFTWTWEAPDPHAGIETLVTIAIVADGAGTEVVVTHARFPDEPSRARHEAGWRTTLPRMLTR